MYRSQGTHTVRIMTKDGFCKILSAYFGEPIDKLEQQVSITFSGQELFEFAEYIIKNDWMKYDAANPETYPTKYGKYFVCRKDGKVHWETWNGTTWAYNGSVITYWKEVNHIQ